MDFIFLLLAVFTGVLVAGLVYMAQLKTIDEELKSKVILVVGIIILLSMLTSKIKLAGGEVEPGGFTLYPGSCELAAAYKY